MEPAIGQRFGKLKVAGAPVSNNGRYWPCVCDCGGSAMVTITDLKKRAKANGGCVLCFRITHGHGSSSNPTYSKYQAMKQRCSNPEHVSYADYGGKGIKVCKRWADSFEAFLEDMGESPAGMSIERIDGGKGYTPGNCKWATILEQANNRSNNTPVTFNGVNYPTVAAACRALGLNHATIRMRINRGATACEAIAKSIPTLK